jgi:glycosyltransferase involved in cell wall biosynthesis
MSLPKVLIAHPGTQYSHQTVRQFERLGVLHRYWTGLCFPDDGLVGRLSGLLRGGLGNAVSNRVLRGVPGARVRCSPLNEIRAVYQLRSTKDSEDILFARNAKFQEAVSEADLRACDVVVGFDTSSWRLAERAREAGKPFILDYSTIPSLAKGRISEDVARRNPDWAFNISRKADAHLDLERRELALADRVVVASSFTKQALVESGVRESIISVNPYGVDAGHFRKRDASPGAGRPLRFVFVGAVNALKGVPMIVDCLSSTEGARYDFTIIGPVPESVRAAIARMAPNIKLLGKIAHANLPAVMRQYDVLVFPSYFEGFGQVILEAMSMGMAVVTTRNSGGPDVIEEGVDGLLIPAGDQVALRGALGRLDAAPDGAREMGQRAALKARNYSWDAYGDRWNAILARSLAPAR